MEMLGFRIQNFRSIVDTGWCAVSPDKVTVLVGQNESGKSAILDALSTTFGQSAPTRDDLRVDQPLPVITIRLSVSEKEIGDAVGKVNQQLVRTAQEFFINRAAQIELAFCWELDDNGALYVEYEVATEGFQAALERKMRDDKFIQSMIEIFSTAIKNRSPKIENNEEDEEVEDSDASEDAVSVAGDKSPIFDDKYLEDQKNKIVGNIEDEIFAAAPKFEYFKSNTSLLLPNEILIDKDGVPKGVGAQAAQNFLKVAQISGEKILSSDRRTRENALSKANAFISKDFGTFWSQLIGGDAKIQIECDIDRRIEKGEEKVYLVFWTLEGVSKLYPSQRSEGVRWFLSFYLQLKAASLRNDSFVFLLDEPGANLHPKAQGDALRLINALSNKITIIYSTHIPSMIEYSKLYRIMVVQRDIAKEFSPTSVVSAHNIAAASRDSLTPILSAMGADFSQQAVIKKKRNVILEEISAFYYLEALWQSKGMTSEIQFVAATGADNVELMANLFIGWGIEFIVLLDDEPTGRRVLANLKRNLCGDSDAIAARKLLKIKDCKGIEDIFSKRDFSKFVCPREVSETGESGELNSGIVKRRSISKPVLAYNFALALKQKKFTYQDLEEETKNKVDHLFARLEAMLTEI